MVDTHRIEELVTPVVTSYGLELYDVTWAGRTLRVAVDGPEGVDLGDLRELSRSVSVVLDDADPVPGAYTLEVSSPGVERKLRRPAHWQRAVGEQVTVKRRDDEGVRRLHGRVATADDEAATIETDDGPVTVAYGSVLSATTVFEWGPTPKPGAAHDKKARS